MNVSVFSKWVWITSGVLKGSVPEPLFLIYVIDLQGLESYLNMFADCVTVMREVMREKECNDLQKDLGKRQRWSNTRMMNLDPAKCKVTVTEHREGRPYYIVYHETSRV